MQHGVATTAHNRPEITLECGDFFLTIWACVVLYTATACSTHDDGPRVRRRQHSGFGGDWVRASILQPNEDCMRQTAPAGAGPAERAAGVALFKQFFRRELWQRT